ncbi:hypothetical protein QWY20_18405, partial [Alkalimonas sp. MEB108]
MSGYQFAHTQTYSLKGNKVNRSARDVLMENSRVPGQANHVKNVKPPKLLFGVDPIELMPVIEQRIADAKAALRGTGQRIQSNTHVLEGAVFSHPFSVESLHKNKERAAQYIAWRNDMIKYAIADAEKRGMQTLSIVEHTDETYPHIHVLSIPKLTTENPRLDAKACQQGHKAAKAAADKGEDAKQQMRAYRDAMSEWQDDLWESVSAKHGLTRVGPRRKRSTRQEWNAQKQLTEQLQKAIRLKEKLSIEVADLQNVKALLDENKHLKVDNQKLQKRIETLENAYSELKV